MLTEQWILSLVVYTESTLWRCVLIATVDRQEEVHFTRCIITGLMTSLNYSTTFRSYNNDCKMWLKSPKDQDERSTLKKKKVSCKCFFSKQTDAVVVLCSLHQPVCLLHLFPTAYVFVLNSTFFWGHIWLLCSHIWTATVFWSGFSGKAVKLNSSTYTNNSLHIKLDGEKNITGHKRLIFFCVYYIWVLSMCVCVFVMTLPFVVFGSGLPLFGKTPASIETHTKYQFWATVKRKKNQ